MTGSSRNEQRHIVNLAKISPAQSERGTVEVFVTNVSTPSKAAFLLSQMRLHFPSCRATFDLEDCDRVFRITSPGAHISPAAVIAMFRTFGFEASVLPDEVMPFNGMPVDIAMEIAR